MNKHPSADCMHQNYILNYEFGRINEKLASKQFKTYYEIIHSNNPTR